MKGLAIVSKGIEDVASAEISELIKAVCVEKDCCVSFDFEKFEDLCLLCYKSQSIDRVLCLLDSLKFSDITDIEKTSQNPQLKKWLSGKRFKVECERKGEHDFRSVDVEERLSKALAKNWSCTVDFKNPDITLHYFILGNECHFGIDFAGVELNKRTYKIFLHSNSIRGTLAYALLRKSGFTRKKILLDPFSKDGIVSIEAALFASGFPINYYRKDKFAFLKLSLGIDFDRFFEAIDGKIKKEKTQIYCFDSTFRHVDYCKKNAKIAGIDKQVNFSRTELEWLDIKFKENTVDIIASAPPVIKGDELHYKEFFYQCEYILKVNGITAVATTIPDIMKKHAEKYSLKLESEKVVFSGEQQLTFLLFRKVESLKPKKKKVKP